MTESITPLEVNAGDILYVEGFRVTASEITDEVRSGEPCRYYTLTSTPDATRPRTLPGGYEGMRSGGNHLAMVARELVPGG